MPATPPVTASATAAATTVTTAATTSVDSPTATPLNHFKLGQGHHGSTTEPEKQRPIASFGTVLGVTDGLVEVYSCDYDSADPLKFPTRESYQMIWQGVFTGFRYQCVELARRYLLVNHGVVFDSIPMAYDIFHLNYVRRVADNQLVPMAGHRNGDTEMPIKGSMILFEPMGFFKGTGHVAIIVHVTPTHVDIVEQNVDDAVWVPGTNYSRRLKAELAPDGKYTIHCTFADTKVLGWMNIDYGKAYDFEDKYQCKIRHLNKVHFDIAQCRAENTEWLESDKEAVQAFIEKAGSRLVEEGGRQATYYTIQAKAEAGLHKATEELHRMFLNATDYVVNRTDTVGRHFRIPAKLWPKIRRSWYQRRTDIVAGRFDFGLNDRGIKCYEYNADSASCLMECGYIQDRWSDAAGIGQVGESTSSRLFQQLVETWRARKVDGVLHLMRDTDGEEAYHTKYMKWAAETAGIQCKVVVGTADLRWTDQGEIQDRDGLALRNVWKTWSWQTALNQLTEDELSHYLEEVDQSESQNKLRATIDLQQAPKLVDVLLHPTIRVFEPLWTVLPSCKAILPVLWELYPHHPYLLKSQFELSPEMKNQGYVTKPITGRGGKNVNIYCSQGKLLDQTSGQWKDDTNIYQELCILPKFGDDHVQICCWAVNGTYGGTVLRVDKSSIIGYDSSVYALRKVADEE